MLSYVNKRRLRLHYLTFENYHWFKRRVFILLWITALLLYRQTVLRGGVFKSDHQPPFLLPNVPLWSVLLENWHFPFQVSLYPFFDSVRLLTVTFRKKVHARRAAAAL